MTRPILLSVLCALVLSACRTAGPASAPAAGTGGATVAATANHGAEAYRVISGPDEIVSVLRNGLVVIAKRVPSPVTSVRGYVRAGSVYEGQWLGGGLSHLLEHLVVGGTNGRRSEEENRNLLQEIGNDSNAYTFTDRTAYFVNTTTANAEKAIDLVTGWMFTANITPAEYAREYEVVQRELEKGKGEAEWVFYELTQANRYATSPSRIPVIGYQEVIRGLSRDDVYAYYKLAYQPNNMVFVVAGENDPEETLALVRRYVKDVPPGRDFSHNIEAEAPVTSPRTVVTTFPKLGQARVELAFPSVTISHADLYALDLLSTVLGGGESSILNERVRDDLKLVTEISASNPTPPFVEGAFGVGFQCDASKVDGATRAVLDALEKVKQGGVDAERVARAKSLMRTSTVYGRQTSETIAESMADGYLNTGDPHFLDRYTERVLKVEPKELQAVAAKYFNPHQLLTTVMLPEEYVGAKGLPGAQRVLASRGAATATTRQAATRPTSNGVERVVLSNGTVLLVNRMAASPVVSINLFALGGMSAEDEKTNGLGNLAMEMISRGTKTRSAQQIAESFDAMGAQLEAGCATNHWFWKGTCLRDDFAKVMGSFADVVNGPTFPESELSGIKGRVLAAIEGQDADWYGQAVRFFRQTYFGPSGSPYQFVALGTADRVNGFTREQTADWYRAKVMAAPRVLAIYGDVDVAEAKRLAERHLGSGTGRPVERTGAPVVTPQGSPAKTPRIVVTKVEVQKTNNPQAGVVIGFRADTVVGEKDAPVIDVADCLTSGYGFPTGYIFEILRGRGLVYDANAYNFPGISSKMPGAFVAYAGCDPKNVDECVDVILESVARLQGTPADLQADWFERAKRLIATGDAMRHETPADQASRAALDELHGLGYDYHGKFADRIGAVGVPDVRRIALGRLRECVVTVSTPEPERVKTKAGERPYASFPPVDLTPKGVRHDSGGAGK